MSTVTYNVRDTANSPPPGDHIGWAMYQLKNGKNVHRRSWMPNQRIRLVRTLHGDAIYFGWNDRSSIWSATQDDLLATDWQFSVEGR